MYFGNSAHELQLLNSFGNNHKLYEHSQMSQLTEYEPSAPACCYSTHDTMYVLS